MASEVISVVRGMHDILPQQAAVWRRVEGVAARCFGGYGYGEIRTPIIERLDLFSRQLGEDTDVVRKEMYAFTDSHNGEQVALRPEATVSTVRALLAGGASRGGVVRVWYGGPMFRHERPQKGRYRQFHQLGAEALGSNSPLLEAEQMIMLARFWRELKVDDKLMLEINNLGNAEERRRHRQKLGDYFRRHFNELDEAAQKRVDENPLRILDSKDTKSAAIAADAPRLADELGDDSRRHVDWVKNKISAAGITFSERDSLVRGLDYYNLTVFEWAPTGTTRRQDTVCGGGRYDGLAEKIGGKPLPGCGFALGVERLLDLLPPSQPEAVNCFLAVVGDDVDDFADSIAENCRDAGISVWRHGGGGNMGKQLKKGDAMRAALVLMVGIEEKAGGYIKIKRLTDGRQEKTAMADITTTIKRLLKNG